MDNGRGRLASPRCGFTIGVLPLPTAQTEILLASRSPRRLEMLRAAGYRCRVIDAGVDDGVLRPGVVPPAWWVAALALLKAVAGAEAARRAGLHGAVVGGDTVCVQEGRIIGQPDDSAQAEAIIRSFIGKRHAVLSGLAVVDVASGAQRVTIDAAVSSLGRLTDDEIAGYIASGGWRGKAGAYNLTERRAAGWPIEIEGDPDTVVGLPLRLLPGLLGSLREAA